MEPLKNMRIYFWNGCQPILKVSTLKGVIRGHQNDENSQVMI